MIKKLMTIMVLLAATAADGDASSSRYQPILATSAGRDSLQRVALWEDGRVTGKGKLFQYLESNNPLMRLRVTEVIGRIQDPQDSPRVVALLKDPDPRVVREAVFALGQIGNRDAVAPLVALINKSEPDLIVMMCEALGKIGGPEAIEALDEQLKAFRSDVRAGAVRGLALAADEAAIRPLLVAINDGDEKVAAQAIYGLEKVKSERVPAAVIPFLDKDNPKIRAAAARTLGRQGAESAVDPLVALLEDPDEAVLINTCDALRRILDDTGEKKPVEPLGELVRQHPSHHVRKAAIIALGYVGNKNAKNILAQTILDRSPGIRAESYKALARVLDKSSVVFIGSGLNDSSRLVRAAAIEALGIADEKKEIPRLIEFARSENDPMMRAAAVRALANFEEDEVKKALIDKLTDDDFVVGAEAATALGDLEAEEAVPAMIQRFNARRGRTDQDVRLAIMEAFKKMKAKQAESLAREAVQDSDKRLRVLAVGLLDALGVEKPPVPSDREIYERDFDRARQSMLSLPFGTAKAIIETEYGTIELELYGDDATQTAANFIKLARSGVYDWPTFHRVVPNFVVQGGCPRGDGSGDPGYNIRSEFNQHGYKRGVVGMAHAGKDTAGSQFFITLSPQPHLNGRYTVFGRVTKGMEVVDQIQQGDQFRVVVVE